MARDRRSHVYKKGEPQAAELPANMGVDTGPTTSTSVPDYRDLLDELIRALARDAARADHDAALTKTPEPRHPHK